MENKASRAHWTTWLTIGAVFASWYFVPLFTERRRKEAEVKIWQHTAMSDAHRNLVIAFYETDRYLNELLSKYKCNANNLTAKMTAEEINKANRLMQQMNTELAMMYMIMPDDKYEIIRDTIEPEQRTTLGTQRENLLSAMRQSQFPGSKFSGVENIRRFRGFKRPEDSEESAGNQ